MASARREKGAAGRPELFAREGEQIGSAEQVLSQEQLAPSAEVDDNDPLQLEHMMGFSGAYRNTVHSIAGNDNVFVKSMGNLLCLENLLDPHDQKLLRGHDMSISAVTVSPSGNFIASGQEGTVRFKGRAAPIFLWDSATGKNLRTLKGLTVKVNTISFSLDERFVCGCGEDCMLYIWDLSTGEVVLSQPFKNPVTTCSFTFQTRGKHYVQYDLVVGYGQVVASGNLSYDPSRVQWNLKMTSFAVPAGGALMRSYSCVGLSPDYGSIYLGTTAGELMVYRRDPPVFRACIPVCTAGLQSVSVLADGSVICGGGDKTLKLLVGDGDMSWELRQECTLDGAVKSVSSMSNGTEVLVTCASSTIYRILIDDFSSNVVGVGHTNAISCISFSKTKDFEAARDGDMTPGTFFATGTKTGELRVWDVADYACLAVTSYPKSGAVLSVAMPDNNTVVSGWEDGFVRCHDSQTLNRQLWYIATAHRGGCTTLTTHIDSTLQYLVTGGGDGAVRVWRLANRELVTQYTEHTKAVAKVVIDHTSPNIVHSVSFDCSVLSYDLKSARRVIAHLVSSGSLCDMTQRRDSENELITCDNQGRLLHWDIDVRDPVIAVQDPTKTALKCIAVSPSGRYVAFAGDDCLLKILEVATDAVLSIGQAHSASVTSVMWTPDERQVISGGEDTCLCVWNFYLGGNV